MKKQKDGKRAKEKKPYIGPRVTVLSPKSTKAKKLVDEFDSDSENEGRETTMLESEPAKAKKRSA